MKVSESNPITESLPPESRKCTNTTIVLVALSILAIGAAAAVLVHWQGRLTIPASSIIGGGVSLSLGFLTIVVCRGKQRRRPIPILNTRSQYTELHRRTARNHPPVGRSSEIDAKERSEHDIQAKKDELLITLEEDRIHLMAMLEDMVENAQSYQTARAYIEEVYATIVELVNEQDNIKILNEIDENAHFEFKCLGVQIVSLSENPNNVSFRVRSPEEKSWQKEFIKAALTNSSARMALLIRQGHQFGPSKMNILNEHCNDVVGGSVLHEIAKHGTKYELLPLLIECQIDLAFRDYWGNTAIIWAIANARNQMAFEILQCGGPGVYLDVQDKGHYNTALHLAVGKGYKNKSAEGQTLTKTNLELVNELIAKGCKVDLPNKDGNTPLHLACLRRDYGMMEDLLRAGGGSQLDTKNKQGQTPADMLKIGHADACKILNETVRVYLLDEKEFDANLDGAVKVLST